MTELRPTSKQIAKFEQSYFRPAFIEKHGDEMVRWGRLDKALARMRTRIFDAVGAVLGNKLGPMLQRIADLESRGPNLADAYKGSWMIGSYKRGSLVTHQGNLFLALKDTNDRPAASDEWKLVVRAGKDAR